MLMNAIIRMENITGLVGIGGLQWSGYDQI